VTDDCCYLAKGTPLDDDEHIETRGDERIELMTFDTNADGKPDVWVVDTDGDGKSDLIQLDHDGDGEIDVTISDLDQDPSTPGIVAKGDGGVPLPD